MKKNPLVIMAALFAALPVRADYVVDVDLGVLPLGDTEIMGNTADGNDNAQVIPVDDFDINTAANWGNEVVFQFTVEIPVLISLKKAAEFTGDVDFFLLDGLTTEFDASLGKDVAQNGLRSAFLDEVAPQTEEMGVLRAGTYYLSAEHFDGFDGAQVPGNAEFSVTINLLDALPSELAIDLGHIAPANAPVTLDTFGSSFNTELAVYDFFGTLLFENDDAGDGEQSEIVIPEGELPEGTYYVVLAGHDAVFEPGPIVDTRGEVGDFVLSFSLGPNLDAVSETGRTEVGSEATETQWFIFSTADAPVIDPGRDLGVLASADEPFSINTFVANPDETFDTQLAVYDSAGFLFFFNDDAGGGLQSEIDFLDGLGEGTWYIVIGGYPTFFGDGFYTEAGDSSAGGPYELNHPLGTATGAFPTNGLHWFRFEVGPAVVAPSIDIASLQFDPDENEFTVSWDTPLDGPFTIRMGTAEQLAGLQAAPNNLLPTVVAAGVTSPVTISVPPALLGERGVFLQVTD